MSPTLKLLRRRHTDIIFVLLVGLVAAWLACQVFIHNPADRPPGLTEATIACFTAWLSEKTREQNKERDKVSATATRADNATIDHEGRIETLEHVADAEHPDVAEIVQPADKDGADEPT